MKAFEIFVPVSRLNHFVTNAKRINEKAAKIGHGGISFEVPEETVRQTVSGEGNRIASRTGYRIHVEYETVKYEGFEFVGKIDFVGGAPVISHFTNDQAFAQYSDFDPRRCDHCHTKHVRKAQFIVANTESNEELVVGHTCMKDFLGIDPQTYYKFFKSVSDIENQTYADFGWSDGVLTTDLVAAAFSSVRLHGWASASAAEYSTADRVRNLLGLSGQHGYTMKDVTEEDHEQAATALEMVRNIEPSNNFEQNLKSVLADEVVSIYNVNIAVAVTVWYQNQVKKAAPKKESNWVGEIKERREFELTIKFIFTNYTQFGIMTKYIMVDDEGNQVVWKCSTSALDDCGTGAKVKLLGTIVEHGEYKDTKQTMISRCKVV